MCLFLMTLLCHINKIHMFPTAMSLRQCWPMPRAPLTLPTAQDPIAASWVCQLLHSNIPDTVISSFPVVLPWSFVCQYPIWPWPIPVPRNCPGLGLSLVPLAVRSRLGLGLDLAASPCLDRPLRSPWCPGPQGACSCFLLPPISFPLVKDSEVTLCKKNEPLLKLPCNGLLILC